MKDKVLVIGSLNVDFTTYCDRFPLPGETLIGKDFKTSLGGKGLNQAVALARAGADVMMHGYVGEDNQGVDIITELVCNNIESDVITIEGETTGSATIIVDKKGENRIIVTPGANYYTNKKLIKKAIDKSNAKYLLLQLEIPIDNIKYIIKLAKEKGMTIILNPAPAKELDDEILSSLDFFTPNETELAFFSNQDIVTIEDVKNAAHKLLEKGMKAIVVTMGSKGSIYIDNDREVFAPAFPVKAIDTVAAGDCFHGYFIESLLEGKSIKQALTIANLASSIAVTRHGALNSIPKREEVDKLSNN